MSLRHKPAPQEDVHLRLCLGEVRLDYRVQWRAARNFIRDWRARNRATIEIIVDCAEECHLLPRLPCERLFLYS